MELTGFNLHNTVFLCVLIIAFICGYIKSRINKKGDENKEYNRFDELKFNEEDIQYPSCNADFKTEICIRINCKDCGMWY